MDEVHYLGDRFRGAVWEEVIIHLSASVRLVSLSATVSNAEEFGEWLVSVRGETEVIVHEQRPVPLWQHVAGRHPAVRPVRPGRRERRRRPAAARRRAQPARSSRCPGRRGGRMPRGWRPPPRPDVIARLDSEGLLPAITFIFSRAGCDAAVRQCVYAGMWLTAEDERAEIDEVVDELTAGIPAEDLDVLGYWEWRDGLRRGHRRAPRRADPGVQADRRGAVRPRPRPGRVRHRDAGARHQHAGPHGRARAADEVQRRVARRRDPGRVHPAHRAGRAARHRRRGPRRRGVDARRSTRCASPGWPRRAPTRCARRSGRPTTWR